MLFITMVYAAIALLVGQALDDFGFAAPWPQLAGLVAGLVSAALWRGWLSDMVARALRAARISTSDHHLTAWDTVRTNVKSPMTCVIAVLNDGSAVMSANLAQFDKWPSGPCILGVDGSLALYVTHNRPAAMTDWVDEPTLDRAHGRVLTCLARDNIAETRVYYQVTGPV